MILALLLTGAAVPQRASDKLPPANPVPYTADAEAAGVMAPINALFAAMAAGDPRAAAAQLRPEGGGLVVVERPDGARTVRRIGWDQFTAGIKPGGPRHEERLTDPAIEVDGDIAMVWSPYTFLSDGKVEHCGTDHFDLVRENGRWRILNVTWSMRTAGCAEG